VGRLLHVEITRLLRFEADGTATVVGAWRRGGDPPPVGYRVAIDAIVAAPVRRTGEPARLVEQSPPELPGGSYAAVGAPVKVGGSLWGAVTALSRQDGPLSDGTEARMAEFTDLVGTAIANAQARADLLASRARIVNAADEARRRIERNLHDGIQQRLVSLALRIRAFQEAAAGETPIAAAAYFVVAEALSNAAKHAHPTVLWLNGDIREDRLFRQVGDDGVGGADPSRGSGLVGLYDRVEALGGTLNVDSVVGTGATLRVQLPLTESNVSEARRPGG
jgi:signal transduction histidine kinase